MIAAEVDKARRLLIPEHLLPTSLRRTEPTYGFPALGVDPQPGTMNRSRAEISSCALRQTRGTSALAIASVRTW